MKYELNALTDFMDFIPSFVGRKMLLKNISSNSYMCKSLGDMEL